MSASGFRRDLKREGRASLVRRDGMHSNELAQNSPDIVFVMRYLRICKGRGLKPRTKGQTAIITGPFLRRPGPDQGWRGPDGPTSSPTFGGSGGPRWTVSRL